jgi:hypothetical protein
MVGANIDDPRILQELSRRYKRTGRHEYMMRLLD